MALPHPMNYLSIRPSIYLIIVSSNHPSIYHFIHPSTIYQIIIPFIHPSIHILFSQIINCVPRFIRCHLFYFSIFQALNKWAFYFSKDFSSVECILWHILNFLRIDLVKKIPGFLIRVLFEIFAMFRHVKCFFFYYRLIFSYVAMKNVTRR